MNKLTLEYEDGQKQRTLVLNFKNCTVTQEGNFMEIRNGVSQTVVAKVLNGNKFILELTNVSNLQLIEDSFKKQKSKSKRKKRKQNNYERKTN